jgi:hypothetical protein
MKDKAPRYLGAAQDIPELKSTETVSPEGQAVRPVIVPSSNIPDEFADESMCSN